MISHTYLSQLARQRQGQGRNRSAELATGAGASAALARCVRSVVSAGYGPLRIEPHAAARLQRARLHPGFIPLGPRPRWLCGTLLLSGVGSSGDRRGRECVDEGDRVADRALRPVFGGTRATRPGALWHQRDAQDRWRGSRQPEREPEAACGNYGSSGLHRTWPQVQNLGAGPVPERARGGHRKGARAQGPAWLSSGGARRARGTGMTEGSGGSRAVAGGPAPHIPVLARPAIDFLNLREGGVYIDGTFGAGGYTRAILTGANCKVIAIDRDQSAIALGADLVEAAQGRLTLTEDRFSRLDSIAREMGYAAADGVVLDLGVSSMQLDRPERGFSFRHDGPLDMRMGIEGASAADVVNAAAERDLANIIFLLGEERHSRAIARAIVRAREQAPIETTRALADLVASVVRSRPGDIHPATRTFQALRIFVNDELSELTTALAAAERILKAGGRLAVVTFHSLEDRIVKSFLSERSETRGGSR